MGTPYNYYHGWPPTTWSDWGDRRPWNPTTSEMSTLSVQWITKVSELQPGLLFHARKVDDVFGAHPGTALTVSLVSDRESCRLVDRNTELMLLVTGFELPAPGHPYWHTPLTGEQHTRGDTHDNNLREVYEYVGRTSGLPIRAGLTVHTSCGTWSSWPPHAFEAQSLLAPAPLYPGFKELFAYITQPAGMWGIQISSPGAPDTRYKAGVDVIRDREIRPVVLGAHPVVAAPGVKLAYLWVYTHIGREKFGVDEA